MTGYCLRPQHDCDADLTASGGAHASAKTRKQPLFPEMIIAGMRELHHVPVIHHRSARCLANDANGTIAPAFRGEFLAELADVRWTNGKTQLVVVAAGERQLARLVLAYR